MLAMPCTGALFVKKNSCIVAWIVSSNTVKSSNSIFLNSDFPRNFIASTHAFNLPTRAFNLATRAFSYLTRGFEPVTRGFDLVTRNS